ncbi:MAG: hypothetical protein ACI4WS_02435 [Oscillospiraceae bacterium]
MNISAMITAIIVALFSLCSCTAKDPSQMTLSDYKPTQLTFTGYSMTSSVEENYIRYYKGEITGETAERLYEIVCGQYSQPELKGGNFLPGTPYLTITAPNGQEYTCSYTWDREQETVDEYGQPGYEPTGTCFAVTGNRSQKFQPESIEVTAEFERLIRDYLAENYQPYRKSLLNKSEKTDNIIFVSRYTNYAWGKVDKGYFIDVWGNMYQFDFSDRDLSNEDFFDVLWEVYCDTDPIKLAVCDSDRLFDILLYDIPQIDRNAPERDEGMGGCDMGQDTLYVVDRDGELIKLRSEGDWNSYLDDPVAGSLCDFYDSILQRKL